MSPFSPSPCLSIEILWGIACPENRALLESDPSAVIGGCTDGQSKVRCLFSFSSPFGSTESDNLRGLPPIPLTPPAQMHETRITLLVIPFANPLHLSITLTYYLSRFLEVQSP